jgi:tRNA(fMet)-specific endonuclease VapC
MSFLLDTDICSAHMRRPGGFAHRFFQYGSTIAIPSIVLAELYAGAYRHPDPTRLLALIGDLLCEVRVIDFDSACAERFGQLRGTLRQQGTSVPTTDLMIASVAVQYDLTLVTHNLADYRNVPGLRVDDWLAP